MLADNWCGLEAGARGPGRVSNRRLERTMRQSWGEVNEEGEMRGGGSSSNSDSRSSQWW